MKLDGERTGGSDRRKTIAALARDEARRLRHPFVEVEHFFLGVIGEGGFSARVLERHGIGMEAARAEIARRLPPGTEEVGLGQLPLTREVKKVLDVASDLAEALRNDRAAGAHLILALLRDSSGNVARACRRLGADGAALRRELIDSLDKEAPPAAQADALPFFRRLTDRARKVADLARMTARGLGHEAIGAEHLLLGLIQEGSGVAANVFKNLGVQSEAVRVAIVAQLPPDRGKAAPETLLFGPGAVSAAHRARTEALLFGHRYIGTEHLLLGVIGEKEGAVARVLQESGLDVERAHKEVADHLGLDTKPPDDSIRVPVPPRRGFIGSLKRLWRRLWS